MLDAAWLVTRFGNLWKGAWLCWYEDGLLNRWQTKVSDSQNITTPLPPYVQHIVYISFANLGSDCSYDSNIQSMCTELNICIYLQLEALAVEVVVMCNVGIVIPSSRVGFNIVAFVHSWLKWQNRLQLVDIDVQESKGVYPLLVPCFHLYTIYNIYIYIHTCM